MVRSRTWPLILALAMIGTPPAGASNARQDRLLARYLAIWGDNHAVTLRTVRSLYADDVLYYGSRMSSLDVFRDKLAFVRRWPMRSYAPVPGTGRLLCVADRSSCVLAATYSWRAAGPAGEREGVSDLRLSLGETPAGMRITTESGDTLRAAGVYGRRRP